MPAFRDLTLSSISLPRTFTFRCGTGLPLKKKMTFPFDRRGTVRQLSRRRTFPAGTLTSATAAGSDQRNSLPAEVSIV
jgi:hypothetical protein